MADNPGSIDIVVSPIQLYALLNGRSITRGEIRSNSWHAMPGPSSVRNSELWRFMQPMSGQDNLDDIRRYLAQTEGRAYTPGSTGQATSYPTAPAYPSRQQQWSHQSHISQPNAPDCWIPPQVAPPSPESMSRMGAVIGLVGSGLEMAGGVLLILTPEPTMATKVGGVALTVHSADVMQAAMRQLFSGRPVEDMTQQAATRAAHGVGFSERQSQFIGVVVDVGVPLAVTGGVAGAAKMSAVQATRAAAAEEARAALAEEARLQELARLEAIEAGKPILSEEAVAGKVGRVTLAEEEADAATGKAGGHTKAQHVDVDDNDLKARGAAANVATKFFSRFTDLQTAEDAINECFKVNRSAMQRWAANTKLAPEFELDLKRVIGRGFQQSSGTFTDFTKVRVVLRAAKLGPKQFFIITSYPIP